MKITHIVITSMLAASLAFFPVRASDTIELLNVSYDPTREFYEKYNMLFAKHWKEKTGGEIKINQSHGGSGKQARSVIDGLRADVVTLALSYDIDVMAEKSNLLPKDWQSKLPHNSSPYTSTIIFLVRSGNPKNIKDWGDLTKDGVQVITPNPKTSGGARWNYLAALAYANQNFAGDESQIKEYIRQLFKNVPVLDTGARGSTTTFVQRAIGDVLITWENEAYLSEQELGKGKFEIIYPSISILAEPPVAVVEKNTERKNTTAAATEYLSYLYSHEAQELAVQNFYRPNDENIIKKYTEKFPSIKMLTIADFGGWKKIQKEHFDDGGIFDQIYDINN